MESLGVSSLQNLQALSALLNSDQERKGEDWEVKQCWIASGSTSNSKYIWSEEEVAEGSQFDDLSDPRPQPEYEVIMKQSVGTEDVFLGLSGKDPSSMSCEALLVKIKLPDTKLTDVVLDVKETFLDLRTPKYKLGLHLPHPVHSQEGKAQFFSDREELEVSLQMNRPLDFINRR
uniref:PIH1D1/2/3 CS-like domain-containing protein n=1 Tax=Periophthalmus magnuspinnatus TaxID=409849 RepID=A0A3B4BB03_9GOBI